MAQDERASAGKVVSVPLAQIVDTTDVARRIWPRRALNTERIKEFAEFLTSEPDVLPPIELALWSEDDKGVPHYAIVDGWHRHAAYKRIRAKNARAILRSDLTTVEAIYAEACRHSGASSLPLSSREKRAAAQRMLKMYPAMSDRDIARIVGCSHMTVNRLRNPLRRMLSNAGDALSGDGGASSARGTAASREERIIIFATKNHALDIPALAEYLRIDDGARADMLAFHTALGNALRAATAAAAAAATSQRSPASSASPANTATGAARP